MWQILLIDLRGWKIQRLTVRLVSICLTFMAQLRRTHAAPHSESAVLAVSRGLQISSSLPKTYKDLQKSYKHCSHQSTEVGVLDSSLAQDPPAVPPSGLEPQQPKGGKCTKHWSDEICSRLAWVSTKAMSFANSSTNIDWLMLLKSSEMMRNAKKFTLHCSTHPPSVGTSKRTNHIWNMLKPSNYIAFFTDSTNHPDSRWLMVKITQNQILTR